MGFLNNWLATVLDVTPPPDAPQNVPGPWRPPGWAGQPQLVSLTTTLPGQPQTTEVKSTLIFGGEPTESVAPATTTRQGQPQSTTYFFDAVIRVDHSEDVVIT